MSSAIDIKIRQLIKDKLGKDESQIKDEATFSDDLEVDSLDFTELIVSIEKEFKVSIADEMYEKLKTVGALTDYVEKMVDPYSATVKKERKAPTASVPEPVLEEQEAL